MSIPLADQIACVRREIAMRRRVYPGWVSSGRMTQEQSDLELTRMQAVLETLQGLMPPEPKQEALL